MKEIIESITGLLAGIGAAATGIAALIKVWPRKRKPKE